MAEPIQEIKEKLDIVDIVREYVPLLMQAGRNFKAPCPFHKEKTPSFIVSPDRQTWHCFGSCNEGGDIISFVMKYESVEFYEALKMLAEKAGIELKRVSPADHKEFGVLYDINGAAKDFFVNQLTQIPEPKEYLLERGLKEETLEAFEVGFAPNSFEELSLALVNIGYDMKDIERAGLVFKTERGTYGDRFRGRIMFPIYNTFGKIVGFSGRIMPTYDDGKAGKYINSPETAIFNKSKILYGFHLTKKAIKDADTAILVEGQMDLLMLYQDGVRNVAATSGTALTSAHLQIVKKYAETIVLAFDSDQAGQLATERAIDMANVADLSVKIFRLSEGKDAAEFILAHPGVMGRDIESKSMSALDFYCGRYLTDTQSEDLKKNIRLILGKTVHIQSPIERGRWLKNISHRAGISESALTEELKFLKLKPTEIKNNQPATKTDDRGYSRQERLAMEIIMLSSLDKESIPEILKERIYFPEPLDRFIGVIAGEQEKLGDDEAQLLSGLVMRASLKEEATKPEAVALEISFLLKELKREYLKLRREELSKKIALLEQKGGSAELDALLKEFDEASKLINNTIQ